MRERWNDEERGGIRGGGEMEEKWMDEREMEGGRRRTEEKQMKKDGEMIEDQ